MKIIHKTPTRIRVKFDEISGKFQETDLQNQILALKGVKSARINSRIKCAIIECENADEVASNLDKISHQKQDEISYSQDGLPRINLH